MDISASFRENLPASWEHAVRRSKVEGKAYESVDSSQDSAVKEASFAAREDTLSLSPEARKLVEEARQKKAEQTGASSSRGASGTGLPRPTADDGARVQVRNVGKEETKASEDAAEQSMNEIKKQIEEAQSQLAKLEQAAEAARAKQSSSAENTEASPEENGGEAEDAPEIKTEEMAVQAMRSKIMQLNSELAEAMRKRFGPSETGLPGVPVGSTGSGCGMGAVANIGSSKDPFAAAKAYEASQNAAVRPQPEPSPAPGGSGVTPQAGFPQE